MSSDAPLDGTAIMINVLTTDPEHADEVAEVLQRGLDTFFRHQKGFIGATLLQSVDGTRLINIATWMAVEDIQMAQSQAAANELRQELAVVATSSPGVYVRIGGAKAS